MKPTSTRLRRTLLTILGVLLLAAAGYGGFLFLTSDSEPSAENLNYSLGKPHRGTISATIDASGKIKPADVINLNFDVSGTVAEILVVVNDRVEQGDPLAHLDTTDLQLNLEKSAASLAQVKASYDQLAAETPPEEIEQAQAQLEQSRGQLTQVQGEVTAEDIAAARAELEQARAALSQLEAGPKSHDVKSAQAALASARANLRSQRDSLSAAKTRAELQMHQAANTLRNQQDNYSNIYWENRERERNWNSPNTNISSQLREREEAALRSVRDAEDALEIARVAYEQAKQAETTGIQAAEAEVQSAEANLEKILAPADPDDIAAAQAQIARAQANLNKLTGQQRSGSVAAAVASVNSAQARLDALLAPPRDVDVASTLAQVQQAEVSMEQARQDLDRATLRAPIDGVVAEVNLTVGERETPSLNRPAIIIADLSRFYVYGTVDEIDVAQLRVGQEVLLTLDALPELELTGVLDTISPLSDESAAVATYAIRVEMTSKDRRVRSGMSATVDIIVDQKEEALLVPRRAVYASEGTRYIDTPTNQGLCDLERSAWPAEPDLEQIEVTTGLSNDQFMEITSENVSEETCIYVEGVDARMNPFSGPPPGQSRRNRGG